jgi:predicted RNA binding protein YcfA (HicA-like mRNA interferase family)
MTAKEAESLLLKTGFNLDRQKGSHRIYKKNNIRIVIPFHSGKELHPKIVKEIKQLLENV